MARFMIVDDSKVSRKIVRELLEGLGHTVALEAASGEEAIEKYDTSLIDCVLLDVEMGGMSGIEATKILKDKYNGIKIIIVSFVSESNRLKEAVLSGADMVVQKPVNSDSLKRGIDKVLG